MLIEELGLSEKALTSLKRTGITTIGDCLDHFERIGEAFITARYDFIESMHGEVRQKLKAHGYTPADEAEK